MIPKPTTAAPVSDRDRKHLQLHARDAAAEPAGIGRAARHHRRRAAPALRRGRIQTAATTRR